MQEAKFERTYPGKRIQLLTKQVASVHDQSKNLRNKHEAKVAELKKQLQEVGHKVDSLLQHTNTPNTLKLEGFSNVLYQEWKKAFVPAYSNVDVNAISCRAVNMMYSRIAREGLGVEDPPPETK